MKTLANFLLSVLAVYFAALFVPGIYIEGLWPSVVVTIILALLNATLGLFLKILTFPINFLTLGLVGFVINVCMISITDRLVNGFRTDGFFYAALFALVVALMNYLLSSLFDTGKNKKGKDD